MLCKIWEYLQITEGRTEQHSASDRERALRMLRHGCTLSEIWAETGIVLVLVQPLSPFVPRIDMDRNIIGFYIRIDNPHIS